MQPKARSTSRAKSKPKSSKPMTSTNPFNARPNPAVMTASRFGNNQYVDMNDRQNQDALNSIASNKEVHAASRAAMKDQNVRNAGYNAMMSGGNDPNANKKLVGALAKNKQVQGAAISVAKDKKVQKAAWNGVKKNATKQNAKKVKKFALSFNM
eukprot:CAMPEP_0201578110 /NCGR_PEP_ID=MMETSP0190_2-20130828/24832_1 /ASSEMBLY_ACC=CAM_ASM_000263 /TAXON_ID=37353 /ORGANISM="Rosalina sp." /LENGTH=153 /DNA_ID=CAMNT_0048010925 /DNA_START=292 /DNA_END=753 /DNA_ORIENTATION=+